MNNRINLNSPIFKVLMMFLAWRFILVMISLLAIEFVPLASKDRFLGGGPVNFQVSPQLFAWANFDGEHYLSIAIYGYKHLEQAFFPVYPKLISFFSRINNADFMTVLLNSTIVGLVISNVSFVLALIFLWELIRIDYSKKIAYLTILLILIFPASFYFGALYNESLFFFLLVASFYSARKGRWFIASVLGLVASATRVFGILFLPALLIESWQQKANFSKTLLVFMIPFGLGAYMWYLQISVGDPIAFYNFQTLVGEQHQRGIITLPQVYFRYIKMLITTGMQNPIFQTIVLEFFIGIIFFLLPIYGYYKKIRLSYLVFAMAAFLIPTIQGSFSSLPRYVIVLFPSFLSAALLISNFSKLAKVLIFLSSFLILAIETALFLRGYWVA